MEIEHGNGKEFGQVGKNCGRVRRRKFYLDASFQLLNRNASLGANIEGRRDAVPPVRGPISLHNIDLDINGLAPGAFNALPPFNQRLILVCKVGAVAKNACLEGQFIIVPQVVAAL